MGVWEAVAVGGAMVFTCASMRMRRAALARSAPTGMRELSAAHFNQIQDQAIVSHAMSSARALAASGPVLYEFEACPFCNKVKAVLDYKHIPYSVVRVDPIKFTELNGAPFRTVPQLQFRKALATDATVKAYEYNPEEVTKMVDTLRAEEAAKKKADAAAKSDDKNATEKKAQDSKTGEEKADGDEGVLMYPIMEKGPLLVDSDVIVEKLAHTFGISNQLENSTIKARREWVATDVVRNVFVVSHYTWKRSWEHMPMVQDKRYAAPAQRAMAATGFLILGRFMIGKRLQKPSDAAEDEGIAKLSPDVQLERRLRRFVTIVDERRVQRLKENPHMRPPLPSADPVPAPFNVTDEIPEHSRIARRDVEHQEDIVMQGGLFHGGLAPDLVDLALYGALRPSLKHKYIERAVKRSGLEGWAAGMKQACPTRTPKIIDA